MNVKMPKDITLSGDFQAQLALSMLEPLFISPVKEKLRSSIHTSKQHKAEGSPLDWRPPFPLLLKGIINPASTVTALLPDYPIKADRRVSSLRLQLLCSFCTHLL
uniref:Uncharacterized protein n=1 Tax=Sphaerodactylus townsendi TaxID=933632 RepID=A0ACB8G4N9_9SAUR